MFFKSAIVSLVLAAATPVMAAPVYTPLVVTASGVEFSLSNLPKGAFTGNFSFTLNKAETLHGNLKTYSKVADDVAIGSAVLSNGTQTIDFSKMNDAAAGTEHWAFKPTYLSAGTWYLTVTGVDQSKKAFGNLDGTLQVPEPASVALSLAALGAMALVRRRKQR
ncbi:FxDxF family PEP-CTERM protein [Paucibacter sp. APW11]|uniref:FxDxF family PEP-CTERM protein n=1 Tax=Roseateles aquae TaxID=3077235 RepID=A0ABU3PH14_9BURK|nr:FxDxF family PEP-CTERM protein [Paucibacter sp. APW11]MDT9001408.1 FxDxF family PEP-CTERM protein [Paucibacter sp. APW11]